jgi:hypothetical protein
MKHKVRHLTICMIILASGAVSGVSFAGAWWPVPA